MLAVIIKKENEDFTLHFDTLTFDELWTENQQFDY